jgi:hypothetical protein
VVDQSGSNLDGPYEHPGQASDPTKTFRYGVISDFVAKHGGKNYISWDFISFRAAAVVSLTNGFSDTVGVNAALQSFAASTDSGDTPYKAALSLVRDTIQQDLAKGGPAYQYRIAFLTDGYPTDYCPDAATVSCPGQVQESKIDADVQAIINLAPSSIQMSTVYYGLPDATATGRLQRMAAVGGGQFVDTNVSKTISLDDVIKVPTTCP